MRTVLVVGMLCVLVRAEDGRTSERVIRALALKQSDVVAVAELGSLFAPEIAKRVRSVVNLSAPEHSADVVVLYGVDRTGDFFLKLRRVLRLGGRVANIDSASDSGSAARTVDEFKAAGFRVSQTISVPGYPHVQVFE